jgi:hypothetical protein
MTSNFGSMKITMTGSYDPATDTISGDSEMAGFGKTPFTGKRM